MTSSNQHTRKQRKQLPRFTIEEIAELATFSVSSSAMKAARSDYMDQLLARLHDLVDAFLQIDYPIVGLQVSDTQRLNVYRQNPETLNPAELHRLVCVAECVRTGESPDSRVSRESVADAIQRAKEKWAHG